MAGSSYFNINSFQETLKSYPAITNLWTIKISPPKLHK